MIPEAQHQNLCQILKIIALIEHWPEARLPKDYLVLDIETLGLNTAESKPVQIGFCTVRNGEICRELWDEDYLSMTFKWPKEDFVGKEGAIRVHGIDYAKSQKEGIEPAVIMDFLADCLRWARSNKMLLVGHNMFNFDIPFLTATAKRFGLDLGFRQEEQLDTGLLVKAMQLRMYPGTDERLYNYYRRVADLRAGGIYWSLDRYCIQRFGLDKKHDVDAMKAHNAGYDCFLTHLLLKELNAILEGVECRKES